jgi:signal-transduction protein with cAMP-binding, CBS, and nucleotidyltransferase domain
LRGIRVGGAGDYMMLRRINVEQVTLEPASVVHSSDPFQKILDLTSSTGASNFGVVNAEGAYEGMVVSNDIQMVLLDRDAIPLLIVGEMARRDLPVVKHTDDLGTVLDAFSQYDVSHLPVTMQSRPDHIIGLISRAGLMRRYQKGLAEPR